MKLDKSLQRDIPLTQRETYQSAFLHKEDELSTRKTSIGQSFIKKNIDSSKAPKIGKESMQSYGNASLSARELNVIKSNMNTFQSVANQRGNMVSPSLEGVPNSQSSMHGDEATLPTKTHEIKSVQVINPIKNQSGVDIMLERKRPSQIVSKTQPLTSPERMSSPSQGSMSPSDLSETPVAVIMANQK